MLINVHGIYVALNLYETDITHCILLRTMVCYWHIQLYYVVFDIDRVSWRCCDILCDTLFLNSPVQSCTDQSLLGSIVYYLRKKSVISDFLSSRGEMLLVLKLTSLHSAISAWCVLACCQILGLQRGGDILCCVNLLVLTSLFSVECIKQCKGIPSVIY